MTPLLNESSEAAFLLPSGMAATGASRMFLRFLPFREADTEADPQGGSSPKVRPSDLRQQLGTQVDESSLMRMLEKHADVLNDNSQLRTQRTTLRQEITDLKSKVAPDGARILTAAEAPLWDAYTALGKPDALKTAIDANGAATAELTALKREKQIAKAAEAAGYKASVLTTLAGDLDIQVEPVKDSAPLVVVVKDGTKTALADYAKENWADFLPALEAKQGSVLAPDINAGARGNGNTPTITDDERKAAQRRYSATF